MCYNKKFDWIFKTWKKNDQSNLCNLATAIKWEKSSIFTFISSEQIRYKITKKSKNDEDSGWACAAYLVATLVSSVHE